MTCQSPELAIPLREPLSIPTPLSGCTVESPTIAATARGCQSGVALPPASPPSRVCPQRRGGSPSGDLSAPPALSLRGRGMEVLIRPPSVGRVREGDFPPLVTPVADEGGFTNVSFATYPLCSCLLISGPRTWPGFTGNPLTPDRGLNSISPSRYVINCGVCVPQCYSPKISLPYALLLSMQQLAGSRPIVDFIRTLNVKVVAKFFSKLTKNYRNSSIHLHRLLSLSAMAKRGKRRTLCRRVYLTRLPSYFFRGREKETEAALPHFRENPGAGGGSYKGGKIKGRPAGADATPITRMQTTRA